MKQNEYDPAETVEIGKAEDLILGWKDWPDLDASGNEPLDRHYVEGNQSLSARTGLTRDIEV